MGAPIPVETTRRLRVVVEGLVQGVGFRPFVWRLARELGLAGFVTNTTAGVAIEIEGPSGPVGAFLRRLRQEVPPPGRIERIRESAAEPLGEAGFAIRTSEAEGAPRSPVLPDLAPCPDCLREVLGTGDRREGYPFANCARCGPRFSIVRTLPYDRPNTTMAAFPLCAACRAEYESPADRRFHAQPTACAACGPAVALWDSDGVERAREGSAIAAAAAAVRDGKILAAKGLGGFHLIVDAGNDEAVLRLRSRKRREEKPFAVLVRGLEAARALVETGAEAERLLTSPEGPIVLLPRKPDAPVAPSVAPRNPRLGVFLPPTPLHHLLMRAIGRPVVATSGNLSDEPIATENLEGLARLQGIADLFLVHDRPIARHVDDSVAWILDGAPAVLRRARGYAPSAVLLAEEVPTILAVGAHLKNAVALSVGRRVFVSQHVGDLETAEALIAFERVIADFLSFYDARPAAIAHDLHPDLHSTIWAHRAAREGPLFGTPLVAVQHHHAHLAACLAEHGASGEALGIVWDGTGYGTDGTVWGGEFLVGSALSFRRAAHLFPFRLPGGDAAVREPKRTALALLLATFGEDALAFEDLAAVRALEPEERILLTRLVERGVSAPVTTSVGRLFDGIASLAGIRQVVRHEGQAAMELEWAAGPREADPYPLPLVEGNSGEPALLDWRPLVREVVADLRAGQKADLVSARFHAALLDAILEVARREGRAKVALAGGCFQNRRLAEGALRRLSREGFEVLIHRRLPPNDGSLGLGQVAVAAARLGKEV